MSRAIEIETIILPDLELVRIDETEHYNAEGLKRHGIKKVYGVYLYDKNCVTRCCSFQEDFHLCYVNFDYDVSSDLTDGESEAAYDYLMEANCNAENSNYFDIYFSVSEVEQMDKENKHECNIFSDIVRHEASENRDSYNYLFEDTIDYYRNNPHW